MSMTVEDLKDAVCDLVSIAEEHVERKYFEELDNKGVAIIDALEELRELKEKATEKKPKTKKYVCPNCKRTLNVTRYDTYCEICCGRLYVDWSEGKE